MEAGELMEYFWTWQDFWTNLKKNGMVAFKIAFFVEPGMFKLTLMQ